MTNASYEDYYSYEYVNDTYDTSVEPCTLDLNPREVLLQTVLHSVICVVGLVGNALVLVTYTYHKRTKTLTDVYLFNVAIADLVFAAALPFTIYNEQSAWWMGSAACKALRSAYSVNLYGALLLLACVSGDRYMTIVLSRRAFGPRAQSHLYNRVICSFIWVAALALTLPTLVYTQRFQASDFDDSEQVVYCEMSFDSDETAELVKILVPSLQMAIGFALPFLVMLFCYSCILATLLRAQNSRRHKAIRVVFAVVVVFILCHLPYNLSLLRKTLNLFQQRECAAEKVQFKMMAFFRSVAYLHCCLNPILYAFVGVKFRSHFKKILVGLWCGKKSASVSRSVSDTEVNRFSAVLKHIENSNMSSFTV